MRILFVTNGFPPHRWAGTENYTAGIAKGTQQRGHQVRVLCAGKWQTGASYWNHYDDDEYDHIPVRRIHVNWLKSPDPFHYLYNNPVIAAYLSRFLAEYQPDLVHVTSCETLSASVLKVVKDAGLPLVLSLTDFWFLCPRINLLRSDGENCDGLTTPWDCLRCQLLDSKAYRWPRRVLPERSVSSLLITISKVPALTRQRGLRGMAGDIADRKAFLHEALMWPDVRITASPFVRDIHIANGVKSPIEVRPYGHELAWLAQYAGKAQSDVVRIGFIGQLVESKGAHLLLEAGRALQSTLAGKFSISIYGDLQKDIEYGNRLRNLAADMPNVQFCGVYRRSESARVYAGIDVLVVPSLWCDFPLVIHEAFATQTPVIATNLGGMAEAINDGINGLMFERSNAHDLSIQLRRLIEVTGLLERLKSGTPRVKRIAEEVDELVQVYDALIRQRYVSEHKQVA